MTRGKVGQHNIKYQILMLNFNFNVLRSYSSCKKKILIDANTDKNALSRVVPAFHTTLKYFAADRSTTDVYNEASSNQRFGGGDFFPFLNYDFLKNSVIRHRIRNIIKTPLYALFRSLRSFFDLTAYAYARRIHTMS